MKEDLQEIKFIIMDVDGVLTDGKIIYAEDKELKCFHVHDGLGISLAKKAGLKVGIITSRSSKAVERRATELHLDYTIQGSKCKLKSLQEIMKNENIDYQHVCYIGDDIVDIPILEKVGFSATVQNAPEYIKSRVNFISKKQGGDGAVREIIEYILNKKDILNNLIDGKIHD